MYYMWILLWESYLLRLYFFFINVCKPVYTESVGWGSLLQIIIIWIKTPLYKLVSKLKCYRFT